MNCFDWRVVMLTNGQCISASMPSIAINTLVDPPTLLDPTVTSTPLTYMPPNAARGTGHRTRRRRGGRGFIQLSFRFQPTAIPASSQYSLQ